MNKLFIAILLSISMIFLSAYPAKAAGPTCQVFWQAPSDGVGEGGTLGITNWLNALGYSATRLSNSSASSERNTMNADAVFASVSHGAPGRIVCDGTTTISANRVMDDDFNFSLQAKFASGAFYKMRFAYWGSCNSAQTDSIYRNLNTYTVSTLSADASLGFFDSVSDPHATLFESNLFYYLRYQATIYGAKTQALADVFLNFGDYGSVDSAIIAGNSSSKIYPVA